MRVLISAMSSFKNRQWLPTLALLGGLIISANEKPYGLTARPNVVAFLNGAMPETAPGISGNWSAVVAFTNLFFTNSVGLTPVPGTDELCVWEREGRVWTFENSPGATKKTLAIDVHNQCQGWDDSVCSAWRFIRASQRIILFSSITRGASRARSPAT
jgi:hypothetical protein